MPRVPHKFLRWVKRGLADLGGAEISGAGTIEGVRQIETVDDLPDPEPSDVPGYELTHQLEDMTPYKFVGVVQTEHPIELGYATPLRAGDPFRGGIIHTGGETAIVSRDVPVWIDRPIISAPGGTAFDIAGDDSQDMKIQNVQVADPMGMGRMESFGIIDGMRVPVVTDSNFEDANGGLTFTGVSNKIFVSGTPFRRLGGPDATAAIEFRDTLDTEFIKVSDCFFRNFDSQTTALLVEDTGVVSIEGKIVNNDFGALAAPPVDGAVRGDRRWTFSDNTGLQDTAIRGGFTFQGSETVEITTAAADRFDAAAYTRVDVNADQNDALDGTDVLELNGSTLTYTGAFDAGVAPLGGVSLTGQNDTGVAAVFIDGEILTSSIQQIQLRPQPTTVSLLGQGNIVPGSEIDIRVANIDDVSNINLRSVSLSVIE